MKKLLLILFCLPLLIMAQAPQGFTYQGVATDNNGFELQNQTISIQASILSSSATGTVVWQETHTTSTDTFGLFNVVIGEGTSTSGGSSATFQEIDWGAASHFMKVEIDVNGGSNYVHVGTSQMMSVPYALYAENANIDLDSSAVATMINNAILQQMMLGDYYQGGVVAYIFQPGEAAYVAGEVHGYLAYYDGTNLGWGCEGVTTAIGVNNTSVGQGPVNTQQLVNTCTETNFAAKWCDDLVIGGYSDWFLPNRSELMLLSGQALSTWDIGGITAWTSQESTIGLFGCNGGNTCCFPSDFSNVFYTNGSGSYSDQVNRKMPGGGYVGGVNCAGFGGSPVIAFRQF